MGDGVGVRVGVRNVFENFGEGGTKNFRPSSSTMVKLFSEKNPTLIRNSGALDYQNSKFSATMVRVLGKDYAEISHFDAF